MAISAKEKSNRTSIANALRFGAIAFGGLLCYGALQKLLEVNLALSIEHWGDFLTGLLLIVTPFVMQYFPSSVLLTAGIYSVVHLLHPNTQHWLNLVLFLLFTVLLLYPQHKGVRIVTKLLVVGVIAVCFWYIWQDFYRGIAHFVETGKATNDMIRNRIITYLPQDFSFYMAVLCLSLSIRKRTHA
jgi:uncharacterized membrane protein